MKHYQYKLINFLNEVTSEDPSHGGAGTAQFYNGDSDIGEQAGKPDPVESELNVRRVAAAIGAAANLDNASSSSLNDMGGIISPIEFAIPAPISENAPLNLPASAANPAGVPSSIFNKVLT